MYGIAPLDVSDQPRFEMTLKDFLAVNFEKGSPKDGYQRKGEHISIVYPEGRICGGDIVLCDEMPEWYLAR